MANLFNAGAEWLADKFAENLSETITYTATEYGVSASLSASYAAKRYTIQTVDGLVTDVISHDFLVRAEDMPEFMGTPVTPTRGDRITLSNGEIFEVLPLLGEEIYRQCDPFGYGLRIHTKKVGQ